MMRTEELVFRLGELCLPRAAGEVRALGAGVMGSFWGWADFCFEADLFILVGAGAAPGCGADFSASGWEAEEEIPARREKREGMTCPG